MSSSISIGRKFHFYHFLGILEINKISFDKNGTCSYICTIQNQREVLEDSCDKIKEKIVKLVEEKLPQSVTKLGNMFINGVLEEIDVSKLNDFETEYVVSFTDRSSTILRHYQNDDNERFDKLVDSIQHHLEDKLFEYGILVQRINIFEKFGILTVNSLNFDGDDKTENVKCRLSYYINEVFGVQNSTEHVSRNIGRTRDDVHAQCLNDIVKDISENAENSSLIKITNMMLDGTVTNVKTNLSPKNDKVFMEFHLGKDFFGYVFDNDWSRFDKLLQKIEKCLADKIADTEECMREFAIFEKLGLISKVRFNELNDSRYTFDFISYDKHSGCREYQHEDTNLPEIIRFLRKETPFPRLVKLAMKGDITDIYLNIQGASIFVAFKYLGQEFSDCCTINPSKYDWTTYYNLLKKFDDEIHRVENPSTPSSSSTISIPLEQTQIPKLFFRQHFDDFEGISEITNFNYAHMMLEMINGFWTIKRLDESAQLDLIPVIKIDDQSNWIAAAFDFYKLYDPTKMYLFTVKGKSDSPAAALYFHLLKN